MSWENVISYATYGECNLYTPLMSVPSCVWTCSAFGLDRRLRYRLNRRLRRRRGKRQKGRLNKLARQRPSGEAWLGSRCIMWTTRRKSTFGCSSLYLHCAPVTCL